jgi:hypothetical protein
MHGQGIVGAQADLQSMGVTGIGHDDVRQVGRAVRDRPSDESQLCGNCANGVLAISPSGEAWPCVFLAGCLLVTLGHSPWRRLPDPCASRMHEKG